MVEVSLVDSELEISKSNLGIFWSKEDTLLVGNFLRGTQPVKNSPYSANRSNLWSEVKKSIDIETKEASQDLVNEANKLTSEVSPSSDNGSPKVEVPFDEYRETVAKRASQVLTLIENAFRKFGIWDQTEERRVLTASSFRNPESKFFSEYEKFEEQIGSSYVPASEGGPHIKTVIGTPIPENISKKLSDSRIRQNLAHEVIHAVRSLSNKNFWKGFENQAQRHWIKRVKIEGNKEERQENKLKKKNIGGFWVGSSTLGSEAIGDLFAYIVYYQAKGESATVKDLIPDFGDVVRRDIGKVAEKMKNEEITSVSRYTASYVAMLQHLNELERQGFGDIEAVDLVALGAYGHVSLEKMPALIKLGVMDQEKFKQMKQVVKNIARWLSSPSEEGFSFQT